MIHCSGYMAPEYAIDGQFSSKSDVFSFGVLILEIICGKKNRVLNRAKQTLNLVAYVSTGTNVNLFMLKVYLLLKIFIFYDLGMDILETRKSFSTN